MPEPTHAGQAQGNGRPTVSMCLIAKDEAENVETCFASFWDHVDEVVLVDTGSADDTVDVARRFAEERGEPDKLVCSEFKWRDDFAAARNYADSLASGDWVSWLDVDDWLEGAENLRPLAARAGPISAYGAPQGGWGWWIAVLWRRGLWTWRGRVDEAPHPLAAARVTVLPARDLLYYRLIHPGENSQRPSSVRRNLQIARRWAAEEPENPRALWTLIGFWLIAGDVGAVGAKQTTRPESARLLRLYADEFAPAHHRAGLDRLARAIRKVPEGEDMPHAYYSRIQDFDPVAIGLEPPMLAAVDFAKRDAEILRDLSRVPSWIERQRERAHAELGIG